MDKLIETIIKAADALDALGKRDLATELDMMLKRAARQPKPRHKVGDQVQLHPHFGPSYLLQIWVLEKDLPPQQKTLGVGLTEEEADDNGRDMGPTPRLSEEC